MPDLTPGQSAQQMLQRQLDELGKVYNAGVRSQSFREWRQNTLTCIQRIWPAEPARPERFRRIPFSPPMGQPGEREIREYFERGCGEAGSLLKHYIADIASAGLSGPVPAPHASAAPGPGTKDDDFPTVDLGPSSGRSIPMPPKPRLKDLLGFTDAAPVGPPQAARQPEPPAVTPGPPPTPRPPVSAPTPSAAGAPPLPQPPVSAPAPSAAGAPPLPRPPVSAPAPSAAGAPPLPASAPAAGPVGPVPPPGDSAAEAIMELESHGFFVAPGQSLRDPAASGPPSVAPPHPKPAPTGGEPAAGASSALPPHAPPPTDSADMERVADELLRASSALSSLPRRASPERPRETRSPVPLAIAGLALEVETLGVPDGHRARARAMLLDLSRRLDAPDLSWAELRDAIDFVMAFPGLGRRMIPLLLPYLDRAA